MQLVLAGLDSLASKNTDEQFRDSSRDDGMHKSHARAKNEYWRENARVRDLSTPTPSLQQCITMGKRHDKVKWRGRLNSIKQSERGVAKGRPKDDGSYYKSALKRKCVCEDLRCHEWFKRWVDVGDLGAFLFHWHLFLSIHLYRE